MRLQDRIDDLIDEAKTLGIPARRLYLSDQRLNEMWAEIAAEGFFKPEEIAEATTYRGLKVVRSSKPGMSVGL